MKKIMYQGKNWNYYTKEEMKKMYPEGGYLVLGEITNKVGTIKDMPLYDEQGNVMYVQPLGSLKKSIYKKDGYFYCEEADGYVVIKKNALGEKILYCLLGIALIVALFFGVKYFLHQSNIDSNAKPFESTIERSDDMDDSRILVPGYNDWNMIAGTDEVYVALYNPDKNPCYFQFSVILDETQEVLFETGLVPPGQAVTTVKLPNAFEEGEYPITVNINSYSLNDSSQQMNGGEVKTKIVALQD